MKNQIAILFLLLAGSLSAQSLYISRSANVVFSSKAPLEDIEAVNNNGTSLLNTAKGEIAFTVPIKAFKFDKDLMREHFNEKYMESDQFPEATYKGKINEKVEYTKDGTYNVTTTGKLKIHGVEKDVTEKGIITVKGEQITVQCEMTVMTKDFHITIPKLVFENIAEKINIKINAPYVLFKK